MRTLINYLCDDSNMSRMMLKEKIKQGPPVSRVAMLLAISRPTFYRQMENYMNADDSKVSAHVKEYFDKVMNDEFKTKDEALAYLEQSKDIVEAEKDYHSKQIFSAQRAISRKYRYLQLSRNEITVEERIKREKEIDEERNKLEALAESYGIDLDEDSDDEEDEMTWNGGEIRTACRGFADNIYVIVDLPYEKCNDVTVEFYMTISNQDFSFKKVKIPENTRCAAMGDVPQGVSCKYSVSWQDGNKIKTVGPFPVDFYYE